MFSAALIGITLSASSVGAPLPPSAPMRMVDPLPSPLTQPLKQPLAVGSRSEQVEHAEHRLVELSMLPAESLDNYYDQQSVEAVRAFQKSRGLTVDGSLGYATWRALRKAKPLSPRKGGSGRHAEVWLDRQLLLLVEDGQVDRVIQVSTGAPGYTTPLGSWQVYLKDADAYSNQYDSPMPWASYYSGGYAIHQSDSVPEFPASHGCTRVPTVFAEQVFNWLSTGDPVHVLS